MEVPEAASVEERTMVASTGQPGGNRGVAMSKDPLCGCDIQPFSQRTQHHAYTLDGGFEAVKWGVATGAEGGPAGLAAKGLDALSLAMRPIADEGMDVGISDLVLRTGRVGTSEAVRHNAFWCPTSALQLTPRLHHGRRWRYRVR